MSEYCTPVGQLLFGETYEIINSNKKFIEIQCINNSISGYILKSQSRILSPKEFKVLQNAPKYYTTDSVSTIILNHAITLLSIGSTLYNFDGLVCQFMDQKITFNGNAISSTQVLQQHQIETLLKKLVNTPYMTGGQSIFGMDPLGLIRFYLKYLGINSPKNIDEMLDIGQHISLIKNAKFGDLVFWGQKNVEQVSILLNNNCLIHCNGMIKISKYDYLGIINSDDNSYEFSKIIKIVRL
jgi:hypothetical protein